MKRLKLAEVANIPKKLSTVYRGSLCLEYSLWVFLDLLLSLLKGKCWFAAPACSASVHPEAAAAVLGWVVSQKALH